MLVLISKSFILELEKQGHHEFCIFIGKSIEEESLGDKLTFVVTDKNHICSVIFSCIKKIKRGEKELKNDAELQEDFTEGL